MLALQSECEEFRNARINDDCPRTLKSAGWYSPNPNVVQSRRSMDSIAPSMVSFRDSEHVAGFIPSIPRHRALQVQLSTVCAHLLGLRYNQTKDHSRMSAQNPYNYLLPPAIAVDGHGELAARKYGE